MSKILLFFLLALVSCGNLRSLTTFDFDTFYKELVDQHNILRKKHSVGALTINTDIAKLAQKTADECKAIGELEHSGLEYNGIWMGQNLYVHGGKAPTGASVANVWYSENQFYDYDTGESKNDGVIYHFTQLVWKTTTEIGCAVAEGSWSKYTESYYVCCNYLPGGNIFGLFTKNVLKPTS